MSENSYSEISVHKYHKSFSLLIWAFYGLLQLYDLKCWRKLVSPRFEWASITNRFLSLFDHFTAFYNCMTWNVRKLISPRFQCTSITKRFLRLFDRFTAYLQLYELDFQKTRILRRQCTSIAQIVFSAYLTVLQLITTVWPEMSENSYLREFSAQVSIVFLVSGPFYTYYNSTRKIRKLVFQRFQYTSIKNPFFCFFHRFTAYHNYMTWNVRKLI